MGDFWLCTCLVYVSADCCIEEFNSILDVSSDGKGCSPVRVLFRCAWLCVRVRVYVCLCVCACVCALAVSRF